MATLYPALGPLTLRPSTEPQERTTDELNEAILSNTLKSAAEAAINETVDVPPPDQESADDASDSELAEAEAGLASMREARKSLKRGLTRDATEGKEEVVAGAKKKTTRRKKAPRARVTKRWRRKQSGWEEPIPAPAAQPLGNRVRWMVDVENRANTDTRDSALPSMMASIPPPKVVGFQQYQDVMFMPQYCNQAMMMVSPYQSQYMLPSVLPESQQALTAPETPTEADLDTPRATPAGFFPSEEDRQAAAFALAANAATNAVQQDMSYHRRGNGGCFPQPMFKFSSRGGPDCN